MLEFSDILQNYPDVIGEIFARVPHQFVLQFVCKAFQRNYITLLNPAEYYAKHGYTKLIIWLKEIRCFCNAPSVLRSAVIFGDISNIKLVPKYKEHIYDICRDACEAGHLHILQKYLLVSINNKRTNICLASLAASRDHVHILQWMDCCRMSITHQLNDVAARCGSVNTLEWLHVNGYIATKITCHHAAIHSKLNALTYLHSIQTEYRLDLLSDAIRSRNLDIVKYVYCNMKLTGLKYVDVSCIICSDNLAICKWAHSVGFNWPLNSILIMMDRHNYDMVEWAHNVGIPYDVDMVRDFAKTRQNDLISWCSENKPCPFITSLISA